MYIQSGELVIISRGDFHFNLNSKFLKSLRFCIILLLLVVSTVPCAAAYRGIIKAYEARAVSLRTADIQNQCTILSNQLNSYNYLADTSSEVINASLTQLTNIYNGRVMIVDKELRVVKDTYSLDEGKTIVSEDVIRCMKGSSTNYYDKANRYIEVTSPIMTGDTEEISGVMLASVSTDTIEDSLKILSTKGSAILGIVFILMLGLSLFIADRIVKPLRRITESIADVSEGYDDEVLHVNTFTETKQLSEAFNKMLGRLKQLDESREEFVSNVSHELRTPLTSMKVLADSLLAQEDVPIELYQEFMGDIAKEIDRENDIIADLLSLVKMDKTAKNLNINTVNINELMELILKRLKPIAEKKNVEVVLESFRPVTAEIDEVKLTLAISNLVENAIKYNHEEGWVHVSLNADHKYFYVKVADSGIGIPEQDQQHIFERFYRVDKSHSREMGGTGLGLAITRNAIIMHRGSIKVYSSEGEGTTFTVRIPLTYVA
ncbi:MULTISPECIES: ATP-binding protein [unclassified Eubacterium (in: firmicutes)]|uniref:sensor histidine kinase n=1 Tax=unclassified Eubacterium (in: firmicutes) TaxID=2624479 RepID=UPI001565C9E6|nr:MULTISPECIES: ATP-binding protein [unclassified Eubacterium (in: firmicutes)]